MPQYKFGVGHTYAQGAASGASPQWFGELQEITVDFDLGEKKKLYGQYDFPVDVGLGKKSLTIKSKHARFNGRFLNEICFGGSTLTSGTRIYHQRAEAKTPSTNTTTITPPLSGTFVRDLGVVFQSTGEPLQRVASAPAAGQYSLSGATYTFAAGDSNPPVFISYDYSTASGGQTLAVTQQLMGGAPEFELYLSGQRTVSGVLHTYHLRLYRVVASKLSIPLKNDDFAMQDFEAEAMANAAGKVFDWNGSAL